MMITAFTSRVARAQDLSQFFEGFGSSGKTTYEAPNGRYHVQVPGGLLMQVDEDNPDPNMVVFAGDIRPGLRAQMVVKKVEVTAGAASSQLMLTTRDNHLAKLPNFTVEQVRKIRIANRTCTLLRARYDYQGNKQYPMALEQAYIIDGTEGFIVGMEVPYEVYGDMADRLQQVYKSFVHVRPKAAEPKGEPASASEAHKSGK